MAVQWVALDHVQLAAPPGHEATAEAFFVGVLGLAQVPKPDALAGRGGCWFEAGEVRIHVGSEDPFVPARKAHPALRLRGLDELAGRLEAAGHAVRFDDEIPGVKRAFTADPFGNRIELVEA